jgi:hypothetical protein
MGDYERERVSESLIVRHWLVEWECALSRGEVPTRVRFLTRVRVLARGKFNDAVCAAA